MKAQPITNAEKIKTQKRFNLKAGIGQIMPGLIELISAQEISWSDCNKNLQKHVEAIKVEINTNGKAVEKELTFYSIITDDTNKYATFFAYCNHLFNWLNMNLSTKEKSHIHRVIKNLLLTLNKNFYNFIGELAVLRHYKSFKSWELLNIGEIIDVAIAEKDADFKFQSSKGNEILIEVLNLHLEDKTFNSFNDLERHLESKFKEKRESKLIPNKRKLFIQPVIWYKDDAQLKFVSNFYRQTNYTSKYILEPLCYYCTLHQEEKGRSENKSRLIIDRMIFEYNFGSVKMMFHKYE